MGYEKELAYQEYVQRENMVFHAPYNPELEFYSVIQSGDVEKTRELCRQSLLEKEGLGVLSKNRLRHFQYHFVITTAIVARYCIRGGMELSVAYSLSDFYIQKVDICQKPEEINELHTTMCLDYAKRMKNLRKKKVCSSQVAKCLDYIYEHMHTRITVETLAEHVKLSPGYLSRLFKRSLGLESVDISGRRRLKLQRTCWCIRNMHRQRLPVRLRFQARVILQKYSANRKE